MANETKNRPIAMRLSVTFWALCRKHRTMGDEPVQESYILARLLPHARSNGSRRVFEDATLTRPEHVGEASRSVLEELEQSLKSSCHEEVNEIAFRDGTANVLGPPKYDEAVWDFYRRFEADVLGEARAELQKDCINGGDVAVERWAEKMRSIGRRSGHSLEKQVLDILSYEARAAFHQCYAAVWFDLIPYLGNKYGFSDESMMFHRLWHLVAQRESNENSSANFYPFHGHIFGLHPASGSFMSTEAGPRLIGQWLAEPSSATHYQRLLHGLLVAIHQYAARHQVYALLRKKEAVVETVGDIVALEEQLVEARTGRRRVKRRKTDAC
jgi:hypothetical protein